MAAHKYGSTACSIESLLTSLAKGFGYQGEFKSTPVEISFSLRETTDSPQRVEVTDTTHPGKSLPIETVLFK